MKDHCGYCETDIDGEPYKSDSESGESYCCPQCWDEAVQMKRAQVNREWETGMSAAMEYKGGRY